MTLRASFSLNFALAGIVVVALAYAGFYVLNGWLFSLVQVSEHISWVFLPAAIRMLAVLLFDWSGVIGLFIGSLIVILPMLETDPVRALSLAFLSSVPSLFAARTMLRLLNVRRNFAGMTGPHLLLIGVAGGLANSIAHTAYFAVSDRSLEPLSGLVPMFVGDAIGAGLMLYFGAFMLRRIRLPARED